MRLKSPEAPPVREVRTKPNGSKEKKEIKLGSGSERGTNKDLDL